jgi:MSHA biogenesis protein MshO
MPVHNQQIAILNKGFTLVEMIAAIVVSAILAIGIVDYIGRAVDGFGSTANRNQLASAGRTAIDRLAMEIHNALPNSIRTTTANGAGEQCIEFIPVRAATNYINPPFTGLGGTTFDVVDFIPTQHGASDGYAVIFPNAANQLYDGDNGPSAGWPNFPARGRIQEISSMADSASQDQTTVTLVKTHRFDRRSRSERFFVVEDPISYCIKGDKLYRYTNYGFYQNQTDTEEGVSGCAVASGDACLPNYSAAPDKMLITDNIDNTGITAFSVGTQTLTRNSLVSIELNLSSEGDVVNLTHEVLTRSVP